MTESILEIKDLKIAVFPSSQHILKGINLTIKKGYLTGIVGESGSGKTMTALDVTIQKEILQLLKDLQM